MDTTRKYVVCCLVAVTMYEAVRGDVCHFPASWYGQWYQSGIGEITITRDTITRKGICRDRHRDYYLIENIEEHCHQCLLVLPRHHNILQYKESYCIGRDSLQSICAQISVEAVLYTLVREPSYPVPCPIRNAYYVTYNNNSGGFCRSPTSYLHQCASTSLFHFSFHKCQYSAYSHEREVDFRCLAVWKEGSILFMYGVFSGADVVYKHDIYRCFVYSILGTVVYMSMSADPTCRGLRSAKDGPMVMELTQDVYGWPEGRCRYPRWLLDRDWRDLSGRHYYVIEPGGETMSTSYKSGDNGVVLESSYQCLVSKELTDSQHEAFIALVHVLDNCQSQFRCILVKEVYSDMVEIHLGDHVADKKSSCTEDSFKSATVRMLIPDNLRPVQCPHYGRFLTEFPDVASCWLELHSSCDAMHSLVVRSSCHVTPVLHLECLAWWHIDDKLILLAEDSKTGLVNCFSMMNTGSQLSLGVEPSCNIGVTPVLSQKITFTFTANPEPCTTVAPSPAFRGVKHIDQSQDDDPGGGYDVIKEPTTAPSTGQFGHQSSNYKQLSSSCISLHDKQCFVLMNTILYQLIVVFR